MWKQNAAPNTLTCKPGTSRGKAAAAVEKARADAARSEAAAAEAAEVEDP
jgi:hypothetical protein